MFLCPCQPQDSSVTTALPTAVFNFAHGEQGVVAVQEQVLIMGLQKLFIRLINRGTVENIMAWSIQMDKFLGHFNCLKKKISLNYPYFSRDAMLASKWFVFDLNSL